VTKHGKKHARHHEKKHARHHEKKHVTKHGKSRHCKISESQYIKGVICYLNSVYWKKGCGNKKKVVAALREIYATLHKDGQSLVMFTAHAIFGTSGFQSLQAADGEWSAKGVLQISNEENYRRLAKVMGNDLFVNCPYKLASLDKKAVRGSALFWRALLSKASGKKSFWGTTVLLNPNEVRMPFTGDNELRIKNRFCVYYALCKIFHITPRVD